MSKPESRIVANNCKNCIHAPFPDNDLEIEGTIFLDEIGELPMNAQIRFMGYCGKEFPTCG